MSSLTCLGCHSPHSSEFESTKASCDSCHPKVEAVYKSSRMFKAGVVCIDCHMPHAGMVAEGDQKTFMGDLRSHLFVIDHRADFTTEIKNGQRVNPGFLTVDYSCSPCHYLYETRPWLIAYASIAHKIRTATILEIFRFQMVLTTAGFLLVLVAVFSALLMKGWLGNMPDKRRLIRIHRFSGWATLSVFIFVGLMCLTFHIPSRGPAVVLSLGWFSVHPIAAVLGFVVYARKILAVRRYHTAWKLPGVLWGIGIFFSWILVSLVAALAYFNVLGE